MMLLLDSLRLKQKFSDFRVRGNVVVPEFEAGVMCVCTRMLKIADDFRFVVVG
jgi:hypothetical protein